MQWPQIMGAIVPVVNLDGVKPGELVLDGPTLASIFLGKITKWNDPAIAKLNPNAQAARRGHRRRPSLGRIGNDLQFHRLSFEGFGRLEDQRRRKHRRGVAGRASAPRATRASPAGVSQTKGAIGYVEYAYAKQNKMTYADMVNHDGKTVAPTIAGLPGRRRQRRLGARARLLPDSDRRARRRSPGRSPPRPSS